MNGQDADPEAEDGEQRGRLADVDAAEDGDDRVDARAEAASGTPAALRFVQVSGTTWTPNTVSIALGIDVRQAVLDDRVHDEQQGHLEQEREAARQRVDAALLEELLLGDPRLHRVALVALLDLLDLGLQELHPALRDELLAHERDHHGADHKGQDDDRPADGRRHAEASRNE